jgi:hypothetical protein
MEKAKVHYFLIPAVKSDLIAGLLCLPCILASSLSRHTMSGLNTRPGPRVGWSAVFRFSQKKMKIIKNLVA